MGASWEQSSPSLNDCSIEKCQKKRIFRRICVKNRMEGTRTERERKERKKEKIFLLLLLMLRSGALVTDDSVTTHFCCITVVSSSWPSECVTQPDFATHITAMTGYILYISTNILDAYVHINMDSEKNGPLAGSCRPYTQGKEMGVTDWSWPDQLTRQLAALEP